MGPSILGHPVDLAKYESAKDAENVTRDKRMRDRLTCNWDMAFLFRTAYCIREEFTSSAICSAKLRRNF